MPRFAGPHGLFHGTGGRQPATSDLSVLASRAPAPASIVTPRRGRPTLWYVFQMAGSPSPRYPRVNLIDAVADALRMRRAPDTEVQAFKAAASECESPEALWKLLSGWKDVGIGGSGNRRES